MKTLKIVLFVGLAVVLASCCACRNGLTPKTPITDIRWTVVQIGSDPVDVNDNYYLTLSGSDDRINGRGDCNSFGGTYVADSYGNIRIGQVAATRAFCPNQQMEDKFFKALGEIDGYSLVEENVLVLLKGDVAGIVLQAY